MIGLGVGLIVFIYVMIIMGILFGRCINKLPVDRKNKYIKWYRKNIDPNY